MRTKAGGHKKLGYANLVPYVHEPVFALEFSSMREDGYRARVAGLYIHGLAVLALALLSGWLYFFGLPLSWTALGSVVVLTFVCALSRRFPLDFGRARVEIADVAAVAAFLLVGPVWALVVLAPAMIYQDRLRTVFVVSGDVLKFMAGGYVFYLFSGPLLFNAHLDPSFVYGAVAGCVVHYFVDAMTNTTLVRLKYGVPVPRTLRESFAPLIPSDMISILTALGISWALVSFGPAAALILFCGGAGAFVSLHLLHEHKKENEALEAKNARLEEEIEAALSSPLTFARRLMESLELRDGYTPRLAAASAVYAADVGRELGLEPQRIEKLRVAALLQDVGLASIPDEVLLTPPSNLNSVGRVHLEQHPLRGERVLASVPGFEEASRWVRWHHERVDGTGYPDRLRGEWLPLEAKVLATASSYAALVLDNPHRPGFSPPDARRKLIASMDKQLDKQAVRVLLRVLDSNDENYARATDARFALPDDSRQASSPEGRVGPIALPKIAGDAQGS